MHSRESQKSGKNNRKLFEITNYSVACLESAQITWHWTKQMIRIIRHAHYTEDERMKQKTSLQRPVYLFSTQLLSGSASGGSGIPVYPKKIRQNTQNSSKYTQNYTQVYFIPEIQRKWYTEYPHLSCNILYTLKSPGIPYTQKPWPTLWCKMVSSVHV